MPLAFAPSSPHDSCAACTHAQYRFSRLSPSCPSFLAFRILSTVHVTYVFSYHFMGVRERLSLGYSTAWLFAFGLHSHLLRRLPSLEPPVTPFVCCICALRRSYPFYFHISPKKPGVPLGKTQSPGSKMKSDSSSRCSFTKSNGHRCRMLPAPGSPLCPAHLRQSDLAVDLVGDLQEFRSAADVTIFLSRLVVALSRNQISTRRAAVLSYVSISLMHALRALQQENACNADGSNFDPLPLTWNLPSSDRPSFTDVHEARAFFAQRYADRMRKIVESARADSATKPRL